MVESRGFSSHLFTTVNLLLLGLLGLACLLPFLHILAVSLSGEGPAAAGRVGFWPIGFQLTNYRSLLGFERFWQAYFWAAARTGFGAVFSVMVCALAAYPLSRQAQVFPARSVIILLLLFALMFDGGLIGRFTVVRWIGIYDTFWSLVLPQAFNPWIILLLTSVFRSHPSDLINAAQMDGASHLRVLMDVLLPLSRAALASALLIAGVALWNDWFYAQLYLRSAALYPLQTFIMVFLNGSRGRHTFEAAVMITALLPVLLTYPWLQRYFVKGITFGAVKE